MAAATLLDRNDRRFIALDASGELPASQLIDLATAAVEIRPSFL
jgi:hypothetical protein